MSNTRESFEVFMSQLQVTNQTLDFFCDFEKIKHNVDDIKLNLCMLNSMIGTCDLRHSVETIWRRDKNAFSVLGILIAVRDDCSKQVIDSSQQCVSLNTLFESVDGIMEFLTNTGLAAIIRSKQINNLVDYVFGVETGLDTNARKNRSGSLMEYKVSEIMDSHNVAYRKQVSSREWPEITRALGRDEKRFDFVVCKPHTTYLIEANFYSGGGSKLNEVARSYSDIAPKINNVPGFEFVWITDGIGWNAARNKLQEAYDIIPRIYNLANVDGFLNLL